VNPVGDRDLDLWRRWHASRSQADLQALMAQMAPVFAREVNQGANIVPRYVLENEAKALALKAFETYDPSRGVLLSTHVTNHLQKLKRTVYARQSSVSIPEQQRITYNTYRRVRSELEDVLGHPPTMDHIADHMALPPKRLQSIINNVEKKEYLESGEGPAFQQEDDDDIIHLAYAEMTPRQKQIFEMRTGYDGTANGNPSKVRTGAQIMQSLNLSQGQLSYEIQKITALLERAQRLRGQGALR
jgi:DNA-directed RNA polymerase specialized sigma subunit